MRSGTVILLFLSFLELLKDRSWLERVFRGQRWHKRQKNEKKVFYEVCTGANFTPSVEIGFGSLTFPRKISAIVLLISPFFWQHKPRWFPYLLYLMIFLRAIKILFNNFLDKRFHITTQHNTQSATTQSRWWTRKCEREWVSGTIRNNITIEKHFFLLCFVNRTEKTSHKDTHTHNTGPIYILCVFASVFAWRFGYKWIQTNTQKQQRKQQVLIYIVE